MNKLKQFKIRNEQLISLDINIMYDKRIAIKIRFF